MYADDRAMLKAIDFYNPCIAGAGGGGGAGAAPGAAGSSGSGGGGYAYAFQVVVTSFEMLTARHTALAGVKWEVLVVDEAQRLKNLHSKVSTALRAQYSFDACLLLTGTPIQNDVRELWSLLHFLDGETFGEGQHDELSFVEKYSKLQQGDTERLEIAPDEMHGEGGGGSEAEKEATEKAEGKALAGLLAEMHSVLKPYMLRRLKEHVESSLKPKEEVIIEVELTTLQKQYYRAIYEQNIKFLHQGCKAKDGISLMNVVMQLRKCCNHPFLLKGVENKETHRTLALVAEKQLDAKLQRTAVNEALADNLIRTSGKLVLLDKLLPRLKEQGHRLLIFSQFRMVTELLQDYLAHRKYTYGCIDGGVGGGRRQAEIDRFSKPGSDVFIMLLTTKAGGVGINLTAADTVIIYDSDWNPQNDVQAMARCHRIGQTQDVKIYRLLTRKTYEGQMFERASRKLALERAVLSGVTAGATARKAAHLSLPHDEVSEVLRHGAYDMFREEREGVADAASEAFMEEDIEQILSRSKTLVHQNSSGGGLMSQFAKASFCSAEADKQVDLHDPLFWEKVVGRGLQEKDTEKDTEEALDRTSRKARKTKRGTYCVDVRALANGTIAPQEQARIDANMRMDDDDAYVHDEAVPWDDGDDEWRSRQKKKQKCVSEDREEMQDANESEGDPYHPCTNPSALRKHHRSHPSCKNYDPQPVRIAGGGSGDCREKSERAGGAAMQLRNTALKLLFNLTTTALESQEEGWRTRVDPSARQQLATDIFVEMTKKSAIPAQGPEAIALWGEASSTEARLLNSAKNMGTYLQSILTFCKAVSTQGVLPAVFSLPSPVAAVAIRPVSSSSASVAIRPVSSSSASVAIRPVSSSSASVAIRPVSSSSALKYDAILSNCNVRASGPNSAIVMPDGSILPCKDVQRMTQERPLPQVQAACKEAVALRPKAGALKERKGWNDADLARAAVQGQRWSGSQSGIEMCSNWQPTDANPAKKNHARLTDLGDLNHARLLAPASTLPELGQSPLLGVSGYHGVGVSRNLWGARITISGKRAYLGSYNTREEAALAYDRAAVQMNKDTWRRSGERDSVVQRAKPLNFESLAVGEEAAASAAQKWRDQFGAATLPSRVSPSHPSLRPTPRPAVLSEHKAAMPVQTAYEEATALRPKVGALKERKGWNDADLAQAISDGSQSAIQLCSNWQNGLYQLASVASLKLTTAKLRALLEREAGGGGDGGKADQACVVDLTGERVTQRTPKTVLKVEVQGCIDLSNGTVLGRWALEQRGFSTGECAPFKCKLALSKLPSDRVYIGQFEELWSSLQQSTKLSALWDPVSQAGTYDVRLKDLLSSTHNERGVMRMHQQQGWVQWSAVNKVGKVKMKAKFARASAQQGYSSVSRTSFVGYKEYALLTSEEMKLGVLQQQQLGHRQQQQQELKWEQQQQQAKQEWKKQQEQRQQQQQQQQQQQWERQQHERAKQAQRETLPQAQREAELSPAADSQHQQEVTQKEELEEEMEKIWEEMEMEEAEQKEELKEQQPAQEEQQPISQWLGQVDWGAIGSIDGSSANPSTKSSNERLAIGKQSHQQRAPSPPPVSDEGLDIGKQPHQQRAPSPPPTRSRNEGGGVNI
jgi:superfamily II DNA/RNA helicase